MISLDLELTRELIPEGYTRASNVNILEHVLKVVVGETSRKSGLRLRWLGLLEWLGDLRRLGWFRAWPTERCAVGFYPIQLGSEAVLDPALITYTLDFGSVPDPS